MRLSSLRTQPKVALVDGFVSADEAKVLVERARQRLACRDSGSDRLSVNGRTSRWCLLAHADDIDGNDAADVAVRRAIERAAWLTGLSAAHAQLLALAASSSVHRARPCDAWPIVLQIRTQHSCRHARGAAACLSAS